jgi:GTP pyrophosphokinase
MTQMAQCCQPVPAEPILGFITQGRGVTIHRQDCPNLLNLQAQSQERIIEVDWAGETQKTYSVDVHINAYDRSGLLRDITTVLANERVNVLSVNTRSDLETSTARMAINLEITDLQQLSRLLDKISQLPNVFEARRKR